MLNGPGLSWISDRCFSVFAASPGSRHGRQGAFRHRPDSVLHFSRVLLLMAVRWSIPRLLAKWNGRHHHGGHFSLHLRATFCHNI